MSGYLSKNGYVIKKEDLSPETYEQIKQELRCRPITDEKYSFGKDISFPVYTETKNKIYIPKMYGIQLFGKTNRYLPNYIGKKWENENEIQFVGELLPHQIEPVDILEQACIEKGGGILSLGTGLGKCNAYNTPILMYDGSIKMVQDIKVGELLMGDDSTPRTVLSLARGQDEMYDIIPVKGEKYTVNKEHILCLKNTKKEPWIQIRMQNKIKRYDVMWWENNKKRSKVHDSQIEAENFIKTIKNKHQDIVEISVKDYLKLSKTFKHHFKGYRVCIDFPLKDTPIDPYMIGFWLGDGSSYGSKITTQDSTVLHYFANNLGKYNLYLSKIKDEYSYGISGLTGRYWSNIFLTTLKEQNLINNKHIPNIYKINSRENRLKLLAGIIDSDGSLCDDNCTFDFSQKSERLIDDVIYLCRSLGFACYKTKQKKGCWYKGEYSQDDYYRIIISGNTNEIPTLIPRKKANIRKQIKDVLVTGITVKHVGKDNYYGFTLNNNMRYVLGDFTVTHNTISCINLLSRLKTKTIIVVNKIPLMKQWEREIKQFLPNARIGFIQGQKNIKIENTDIIIAMLQSLARIDYPDDFFEDIGGVVVDECHNTSSKVFSNVLKKLCCKYTIGLSATPKRSDGCEYVFKWHLGDIVYSSNTLREGLPPIIKLIKLKSDDYKEITVTNTITGQNQIQFTSMLSDLIQMPKRNELILKTIMNCVKENRTILVMSDRRSHLQLIYNNLQAQSVSFTYGLFLGQMKSKDLDKSMSCQVILATYSAFSEGVSKKDLDTLILITPKKYIGHLKNASKNESGKMEQIVGRIFRKEHTEIHPMIIDLCDDFSVYKNQSFQRMTFYKSHFKNYQLCKAKVDLNNDNIQEIIEEPKKNENENQDLNKQLENICLIDD